MAVEHKLAIFRGLLKFKSNQQKIWGVLIFLSIVTTIEVALGIIKPAFLLTPFLSMKLLNWIFIILTKKSDLNLLKPVSKAGVHPLQNNRGH